MPSEELKKLITALRPFPQQGDKIHFKHGKVLWEVFFVGERRTYVKLKRDVKSKLGWTTRTHYKTLYPHSSPEWEMFEIVT